MRLYTKHFVYSISLNPQENPISQMRKQAQRGKVLGHRCNTREWASTDGLTPKLGFLTLCIVCPDGGSVCVCVYACTCLYVPFSGKVVYTIDSAEPWKGHWVKTVKVYMHTHIHTYNMHRLHIHIHRHMHILNVCVCCMFGFFSVIPPSLHALFVSLVYSWRI